MDSIVIDYYNRRFGENLQSAFIHLVREIGEIALSLEKANSDHAKLKITESIALLYYIASKYYIDVNTNMQSLYTKKMSFIISEKTTSPFICEYRFLENKY